MKAIRMTFLLLMVMGAFSTAQAQLAETWQTGQKTSYAAGDDGDLQAGVAWPSPRFVDNGNGTVTDNLTGLIWLKNASCAGGVTWANAVIWCNNLASGTCGLTDGSVAGDWRLPNRKELMSLVDYSRYAPALPQGHPFSNVQSSDYWSATTNAYSTSSEWIVRMIDGDVSASVRTINGYVWPVRAGQSGSLGDLSISYPNGGESLTKGSDYTIRWNSQNISGMIQIDLYKGGTQPEHMLLQLAAATENDGEYLFNPPESLEDGSDYYIGISAENGTIWDFSDAAFTIQSVYQNQPPSTPILLSPSNNAIDVDPINIILQWNASIDPVGDAVEYCVTVTADSEPDDIPVFTGCEEGIFSSNTLINLSDHIGRLTPGKKYWWAVWAKDQNGNWSEASEWWSFTPKLTLEYLNQIPSFGWIDLSNSYESLYAFVRNSRDYPNYVYDFPDIPDEGDIEQTDIPRYCSVENGIPEYNLLWQGGLLISPWFDAKWENELPDPYGSDNCFNTVYMDAGNPFSNGFEVISWVDEISPFAGTTNHQCYFFTYDTKNDHNGNAVTLEEWVDYVKGVTTYYQDKTGNYQGKISKLTIIAHGLPGIVKMSEEFDLKSDMEPEKIEKIKELKNVFDDDAVILLFSCNVGKDEIGKEFVQNLANWTGATVYANTEKTGHLAPNGNIVSQDWELDVIAVPDNYMMADKYSVAVQSDIDSTVMLPGGVIIKIGKNALSQDGELIIENASEKLDYMGIDVLFKNIGAVYEISFEGTIINNSNFIEIRFPYDPNRLNPVADTTVMYWDEDLQSWSSEGIWDVLFFEDQKYVYFKANHTTVFAVLQDKNDIDDDEDGYTENEGDCNDSNSEINPGAEEICGDGMDNNCNGLIDEDCEFILGDLNGDGIVDKIDIQILGEYQRKPVSECPECDLNGDGKITVLDSKLLKTMCTCPKCNCSK